MLGSLEGRAGIWKGYGMSNTINAGEILKALARQYDLIAIYAFGSRAGEIAAFISGKANTADNPASDVDIGFLQARGQHLSMRDRMALTRDLEDALHADQVDLVPLSEANPFLALEIVRGELLYSAKPDEEAEYQLFILRQAGDLAPFQKERMRLILEEEAI
jgi:predicted nucleotidyltransferase